MALSETCFLRRENELLRERLSKLSDVSLCINESLDLDTVLQGVVDGARSLTGARQACVTVPGDGGLPPIFITSGMTLEDRRLRFELPGGRELFEHLSGLREPLRVADFSGYAKEMGLPEIAPPLGPVGAFLGAPIPHMGDRVGNFYLSGKEGDAGFTPEDESMLVLFASQAALAIANARRFREEQRAKADLEALIHTSPVGVVVLGAGTGKLLSINREALRIVDGLRSPDQSVEQLLEMVTFRRADGREVSLNEFSLAELLSAGETVRAEEIWMSVPDGQSVTALINASPIYLKGDELESFVVTIQDMTSWEEIERMRVEFLGIVSHELRTPLTSIRGSATALLDDASSRSPAEMREFFRIIVEQADQMGALISNLLDVARIEAGTLPVDPKSVKVIDLIDSARNIFSSGGGVNDIHIDVPYHLPLVMADRQRIVQVLGNLLSNAAMYSSNASPIRVSAVWTGQHVAFSVTDEGQGIPGEKLPHLFRKHFRLDTEGQGHELTRSGLGLAICKGIVEAHGGRIWAESRGEGFGTRFSFTIPVVEENLGSTDTLSAQSLAWSSQNANVQRPILVVDDDPRTLWYVRDALWKAGYNSIVTGDPREVLSLIKVNYPLLVLLDMMLPGTDGITLMQEIRGVADVPVIFLSAYGQEDYIIKALDMGAVDYIAKPFSPTELAARIRAALRQSRSGQELPEPYMFGDLTINYAQQSVTVAGHPVELTPTEYSMLYELSVNAGHVLTHDYLLRRIWGPEFLGYSQPVRSFVKKLRRKLGDDSNNPKYIFTRPRVGYRLGKGEWFEEATT